MLELDGLTVVDPDRLAVLKPDGVEVCVVMVVGCDVIPVDIVIETPLIAAELEPFPAPVAVGVRAIGLSVIVTL